MVEDGQCVVYHCLDNDRWHHGAPLRPLEFPINDAPTIETILAAYPPLPPVALGDLPHPASSEDLETKADIACALFQEGFLRLVDMEKREEDKEVKDIETDFPISGNLGGAHSKVKKMKKMKNFEETSAVSFRQ